MKIRVRSENDQFIMTATVPVTRRELGVPYNKLHTLHDRISGKVLQEGRQRYFLYIITYIWYMYACMHVYEVYVCCAHGYV